MCVANAQRWRKVHSEVAAAVRLAEDVQQVSCLRLLQRCAQLGEGDAFFVCVALEKGARLGEVELEVVELTGVGGGDLLCPTSVLAQQLRLVLAQAQKLLALAQVLLVDMQLLCQVRMNMHLLLPPA
jgi:hypothetical protein